MSDVLDTVLRQQARGVSSDGVKPTFSVIIEDAERGVYGIQVRRYIDADRAGFCGYVKESMYGGLGQVEASEITRKLNQFAEEAWAR